MISGIIYLYSFILTSLATFFDFLLPFPVPDAVYNSIDVIYSFWYYGLQHIPETTITFARFLFFSFTFYIVLKIVALIRLPLTWLERQSGLVSDTFSPPPRSSFLREIGDVSSPVRPPRRLR